MARGKTKKSIVDTMVVGAETALGRKLTENEFAEIATRANTDHGGEWEPVGGIAYKVESCTCCTKGVKVSHAQYDHTGMVVLGGYHKSGGYDRYNATIILYANSITQDDGVEKGPLTDPIPYTVFRKHHRLVEIGKYSIKIDKTSPKK